LCKFQRYIKSYKVIFNLIIHSNYSIRMYRFFAIQNIIFSTIFLVFSLKITQFHYAIIWIPLKVNMKECLSNIPGRYISVQFMYNYKRLRGNERNFDSLWTICYWIEIFSSMSYHWDTRSNCIRIMIFWKHDVQHFCMFSKAP